MVRNFKRVPLVSDGRNDEIQLAIHDTRCEYQNLHQAYSLLLRHSGYHNSAATPNTPTKPTIARGISVAAANAFELLVGVGLGFALETTVCVAIVVEVLCRYYVRCCFPGPLINGFLLTGVDKTYTVTLELGITSMNVLPSESVVVKVLAPAPVAPVPV